MRAEAAGRLKSVPEAGRLRIISKPLITMAQFPDEQSEDGSFERQPDEFRNRVNAPEAGRYHLYVCKACPWANRAWLTRNLMGLEDAVSVSFVDPIRDEETGWAFREGEGHGPDEVENFKYLSEAYRKTNPDFKGRITVPVLWDKKGEAHRQQLRGRYCRNVGGSFQAAGRGIRSIFSRKTSKTSRQR